MYVIDMTHFVASIDELEGLPGAARRLATYFGRIVEAATASPVRGRVFITTVRCRRRPGRRACPGRIGVLLTDVPSRIEWWCPHCADGGVIWNWRHTPWDLSLPGGRLPRGEIVTVHMPEDVHRALDALSWGEPDLARLVRGAECSLDNVLIEGPAPALALLRDRVAERMGEVSSERGRRLLDHAHFLLEVSGCG